MNMPRKELNNTYRIDYEKKSIACKRGTTFSNLLPTPFFIAVRCVVVVDVVNLAVFVDVVVVDVVVRVSRHL